MKVENLKTAEAGTTSFLNNLRNKTAESHNQLELLPISKSIVDPNISVEQYSLYLNLMYDVVQDLENNIYPILKNVISDLDDRKKSGQIIKDLQVTGIERKQTISPFTQIENISVAYAMGMMYVLEGSTLGGRFIVKNIQENLGYDEDNGASYFSGYGNKTGSFWKKFLNSLTDFETETNSQEEIIAGAEYAFRVIHRHLAENSI